MTDIVSRIKYHGMRDDVARVLRNLEPIERRIARDDQSAHFIMRILPYREPDGSVSGVIVTFVDVTSIVEAEAALVAADARKDVFLATLSHELRNPLAPIRTSARLLQSSTISGEQLARAQSIINRQVTHMSSLLDDLLDVSRITHGSFPLKKEFAAVTSMVDAAVEEVQPLIQTKHHRLVIEPISTALTLEADPVRITQIISNLLTNAAKYTAHGGIITLGAYRDETAFNIFVRDNGIGLSAESLASVFSMFARVNGDIDRSSGGLGIGLALAQGLAGLHGGRIEARSAGVGLGSEFVLILPTTLIVDPAEAGTTNKAAAHVASRRVLIADDNRDGAESLGMFLEILGHEVAIAHSGTAALAVAAKLKPEVGVLDIGMPGMNGYELAQQIRREPWGASVRLIALTGWGQDSDKTKAMEAGFDHHFTKPVDLEKLEALLQQPGE